MTNPPNTKSFSDALPNAHLPDTLPLAAAALGFAGMAGAVSAYALFLEPFWLELTTPTIFCPRLPQALDGLTVLLLADTHTTQIGRGEMGLLRLLQTLATPPDIVVWGGDILQKSDRAGESAGAELCRRVRAIFPDTPTFAVLGNAEHKIKMPARREFVRLLRNEGIIVLNNAHAEFAKNGATINIVGVDDPYYGHADLETAFAGVDVKSRFTLFLAHSPQVAVAGAKRGADVMLSGHTHGGQIRLPLIGALRTQNPLSARMDFGLFDRARLTKLLRYDPGGDMQTYITRGVGVAQLYKVPFYPRLLCRPEVTLLTLRVSDSTTVSNAEPKGAEIK